MESRFIPLSNFETNSPENEVSALVHSFDAREWATAFVRLVKEKPEIATDEGTMTGWFANAIMCGYDHAKQQETTG